MKLAMNNSHPIVTGVATVVAAFAAAASVCQAVGYFQAPSAPSAAAWAGVSVLFASLANPLPDLRNRAVRWGAPLLGGLLLALGMPLLAAAAIVIWGLLAWAPTAAKPIARLRSGLGIAGALLVLGHLAVPLWIHIEVSLPELSSLATLGGLLLELVGRDVAVDGAVIQLSSMAGNEALLLDPFKLGGLFTALAAAFTALLVLRGRTKRDVLIAASAFVAVGGYALVRLLVLAGMPELFDVYDRVLDPTLVYFSFAPLAVLIGVFAAGRLQAERPPNERAGTDPLAWRPAPTLAAAAGGVACVAVALVYHHVGELRAGGVLMDESHGRWEASDVPFDTNSWGRGSTYNYAELADLLGRHYDFEVNRDQAITPALLANEQVVILKTPSSPYTAAELDALHEFVTAGGGIWLIGDHTNLYGMSDALNPIAAWAGMEFRKDAVYDATSGQTTFNDTTVRFHPSAIGSDDFAFQTSCSLAITGPGVEPVLVGWRGTGEYVDYGHPNFFGNLTTELEDRTGLMLQAAIGSVGAGKVAAFTDSTVFSNFAIFDPGVSELALRTVQSLRFGSALPRGWRGLLLALGIALCGAAAFGSAPRLKGQVPLGTATFAVAFLFGQQWVDGTVEDSFAPPTPSNPYRVVAFLQDASTFALTSFVDEATTGFEDEHAGHDHAKIVEPLTKSSLSTFVNWTQRVPDARPLRANSVADAIDGGAEMIVLFDPVKGPEHEDVELLKAFVGHGGVLLVLDDLLNARGSAANAWLSPFDLELELRRETRELFEPRASTQLGLTRTLGALAGPDLVLGALAIAAPVAAQSVGTLSSTTKLIPKGGSALYLDEVGDPIGSMVQLGAGRVGVFTRSSALTNDSLGGRFDLEPDAETLAWHLTAVELIEACLNRSARRGAVSE